MNNPKQRLEVRTNRVLKELRYLAEMSGTPEAKEHADKIMSAIQVEVEKTKAALKKGQSDLTFKL